MNNSLTEILYCEVCYNKALTSVLNLGYHPLCDDLIPINDTQVSKTYPIEILFCAQCKTAHQRFQINKKILFPANYHYRARLTADVLDGMRSLVHSCSLNLGSLNGFRILDIGCNDGSLLDFFKEQNAFTIGIEPTDAALDAREKGHVIYQNYFSVELANQIKKTQGTFDLITFTNVFAHIDNLSEVLEALRALMSHDTIIVIENHYLGAILNKVQFDTFYHEHPRTYSYNSFKTIANSLQVNLFEVEFPRRYGGNIRVFFGNRPCQIKTHLLPNEINFEAMFKRMNVSIKQWQLKKTKFIEEQINLYGPLGAKAFPGRAAILIQLLGLNESTIEAVYEKPNSLKIGHYVPGTRIPIISEDILFNQKVNDDKPIINFAWHIHEEIKSYLKTKGYKGDIIDILTEEDFKA